MRRACVVLLAVLLAREAVADVLVRVVDEAGLPLASTEVQEFGSSDSPARTDAEGRCTLPRETPLNLCVSAFGRASRFVQVEAGQVEVRVELATGGALSGFVRDSEGRPVPRVTLLEASGSPCERSTMTDEQGRYDFLSRAPGLQRIALAGADILTPPEQRLRLAPAESRQLDFVVHRIGYLILLLKNPDGSACTDQAELRLASQWHSLAFDPPLTSHQLAEIGARKSQALVDGRLELAALPLHAEWPVAIHVEGRPLLTVRVPLLESTAEHDVVVPFGGVLSGRLVTAEGKPWPHPRVVLLHLDARKMGLLPDSLPSGDEEGRIEVRGLPAGTWDFELTAPGARPRILRDVPIQPGQTSSFGDLALERGVSIEGRVTDDRGLPIPDASVLALPQIVGRPYLGRSVITNADGRFVHDGLEPGTRLELMVYATGHLMWGPQDCCVPALG